MSVKVFATPTGIDSVRILLLGIWLVLTGVFALLSVSFIYKDDIMAILAIAAGILILINR